MILKVLCIVLMVHRAAGDCLLQALEGINAENKVGLCFYDGLGTVEQCVGVLVDRQWALARASCVHRGGPRSAQAVHLGLRPVWSCDNIYFEEEWPARVESAELHAWRDLPGYDVALLRLDHAFVARVAPLQNTTEAYEHYSLFDQWITQTIQNYRPPVKVVEPLFSVDPRHALMFLTVVLLPIMLFSAFFCFVVFCTGTPVKVPYKNIDYDYFQPPVGA